MTLKTWMHVPHEPTHFSALQSRQPMMNVARKNAKSFATISEAMHRHSD